MNQPPPDMRPTAGTDRRRPSLLIEGWRGVNHSFAMVNQHHIIELLRGDRLDLFHTDMPFAFPHWTRGANSPGFSAEDQARIDAVPPPPERVDCIYRIAAPFTAPVPAHDVRTVTFMITEMGLSHASFRAGSHRATSFTQGGNRIVTSTAWSRDRLAEYGFAAEKIDVIPLGVDAAVFSPLTPAERQTCRAQLGFREDDTVFLNIGVAVWNKGIDKVLTAFAHLRGRGRKVRLILKDQRDVYGISVDSTVRALGRSIPELLQPATLAAISVIPGNLGRAQLRALYGVADCYLSPYRAEGFNLPVIEAIACGTPAIVTRGGATDDFCDDAVSHRISGRLSDHRSDEEGYLGRYIEPDLDELVAAMHGFSTGQGLDRAAFDRARAAMLPRFTWRRGASQLAALTLGIAPDHELVEQARQPAVSSPAPPRRVQQRDLLDVLSVIAPLEMLNGGKIRLGGPHDGGYVVPNAALGCDTVLSIGVGGDVSFDLALAERGARVLQFDHTVAQSPTPHGNFTFHRLGWGAQSYGSFLALPDMRRRLGDRGANRTMLKFDIEGAEYPIIDSLGADDLADFAVIVCELHNLAQLGEPDVFDTFHRCVTKLTLHHAPVHLHPNNYGPLVLLEGVPIPDVIELSLLRRDLDVFPGPSREPIPGEFDRPNHPQQPDLVLTAFAARGASAHEGHRAPRRVSPALPS
jgi:glycosyltransferase involved in cell wall biosynthesis